MNEKLLKNNSQYENSKEKLSVDVNAQFVLNSLNKCLEKNYKFKWNIVFK